MKKFMQGALEALKQEVGDLIKVRDEAYEALMGPKCKSAFSVGYLSTICAEYQGTEKDYCRRASIDHTFPLNRWRFIRGKSQFGQRGVCCCVKRRRLLLCLIRWAHCLVRLVFILFLTAVYMYL